jgi:hypothetical protein
VYNPAGVQVHLRIPPVCEAMSTVSKRRAAEDTREWVLTLAPRTSAGSSLSTVICGFVPGGGDPTYYPAAPTFASAGVRVIDRTSSHQYGHVIHHASDRLGGLTYDLVFYNDSDRPTEIACALAGLDRFADSLHVSVVDRMTARVEEAGDVLRVPVPAKSRVYRSLTVGDRYYAGKLLRDVAPFARFALCPNPMHGSLTVSFMMPEGMAHVVCRLFDPRGRMVWDHTQAVRGGRDNRMVWDGRTPQGRPVAAGTYVLRLSAYGRDGRHVASLEQQLIHLR